MEKPNSLHLIVKKKLTDNFGLFDSQLNPASRKTLRGYDLVVDQEYMGSILVWAKTNVWQSTREISLSWVAWGYHGNKKKAQ